MPTIPYLLTGETLEDLALQTTNLFQDVYENGIGGAGLGDVFSTEGDVLNLRLHSSSGLKKVSNQLSIKLANNSGLSLTSTGLSASISQGNVNTSDGEVGPGAGNFEPAGGVYCFYPQLKGTDVTAYLSGLGQLGTSYVTNIWLSADDYAQFTYITSSGEIHWVFLLRDKTTGRLQGYQAPDHPCFGHSGDPILNPHPFPDYDETKHEIIVINPSREEIKHLKVLCKPPRLGIPAKSLLEMFCGEKPIVELNEHEEREYPPKEITVAVIKDEDRKPLWLKEKTGIIKLRIPQPDYIKVRSIKRIRDVDSTISI